MHGIKWELKPSYFRSVILAVGSGEFPILVSSVLPYECKWGYTRSFLFFIPLKLRCFAWNNVYFFRKLPI